MKNGMGNNENANALACVCGSVCKRERESGIDQNFLQLLDQAQEYIIIIIIVSPNKI